MDRAFDGPRRLVSHARDQVKDAEQMLRDFIASQRGTRVINFDPKTREHVHCIRVAGPDLSPKIANVVKDAAGNLRDALDHAVYAAAIVLGTDKAPRNTGFPFDRDEAAVARQLDGKRLSGNPPEVRALLAGFKPYKGGNDTLWRLNQIRNPNTHRFIVPVGHTARVPSISLRGGKVMGSFIYKASTWNPATKEIELFRTTGQSNLHPEVEVTFKIEFEGIEAAAGKEVISTLEGMIAEVERVVNAIEAECRRLKAKV